MSKIWPATANAHSSVRTTLVTLRSYQRAYYRLNYTLQELYSISVQCICQGVRVTVLAGFSWYSTRCKGRETLGEA
jgi:hypothetical protein